MCDLNRWDAERKRPSYCQPGGHFSRLGRLRCAPFHTVFRAGFSEGHPWLPHRAAAAQPPLAGISVEAEGILVSSLRGRGENSSGRGVSIDVSDGKMDCEADEITKDLR